MMLPLQDRGRATGDSPATHSDQARGSYLGYLWVRPGSLILAADWPEPIGSHGAQNSEGLTDWSPSGSVSTTAVPQNKPLRRGRLPSMNSKSLSLLLLGAVACSSSSGPAPSVGSGAGGSGTGGVIAGSGTGGVIGTGGRSDTGGSPAPSNASGGQPQIGGSTAGPGSGGSTLSTGSGGLGALGGAGGVGPVTGGRGPATTGGAPGGAAGGSTGGSMATGGGTAGGASGPGGGTISGFAVVTDRYDNVRSASNLNETVLTTSNVTASKFGLLFSRTIVGYVYGQPLFVGGLTVNGARHNVVYVATQHNMVYAFDADAPTPDSPLWSKSLGTSMTLGAGADYDPGCLDLRNEVGITSTPVISLADGKIYVVAKTTNDQQLHALDLATGAETAGSPISVGKTAMPALDVRTHLNRPGLLLVNGTIYIAFGSHCDNGAYHGWIFGYDAKTLTLKSTYNSTPTGTQGAIWQSGVGLTSDGTDLWATVANGTSGGDVNMGNNVVRLTPTGAGLTVSAHYQAPVSGDNDLQSGAVLLGNTGQVVGGGKDGDILLLGQADLSMKSKVSIGGEVDR